MASEKIKTGKSIYGGYYTQDSKGNIGRGSTPSAADTAYKSASDSKKK